VNSKLTPEFKPGSAACFYACMLENEAEILALIEPFEVSLLPCANCGQEKPRIEYAFYPGKNGGRSVKKEDGTYGVEFTINPHGLYASCSNPECGMQTVTWYAEDDEEDFKESLRRICESWNRRYLQE